MNNSFGWLEATGISADLQKSRTSFLPDLEASANVCWWTDAGPLSWANVMQELGESHQVSSLYFGDQIDLWGIY